MTITNEIPIVENYNRKYTFPLVQWLDKDEFRSSCDTIVPFVYDKLLNEKQFIAKNDLFATKMSPLSPTYNKNTFIGSVNSQSNDTKLTITSENKTKTFDTFYVLSLNDPNSYKWVRTERDLIPNYAYRACLNHNMFEYFYIGRTICDDDADGSQQIGYVCRSDGLLYVYDANDASKCYNKYEILCLKPSPNTLKQLCRMRLRDLLENKNSNIEKLDKLIPSTLIDYLKYRSFMINGECLLKNEKLVSDNGLHELKLTNNGKLIHSRYDSCERSFGKTSVLYDFVDSIWIQNSYAVINRYDNAFVYFLYMLCENMCSSNDVNDNNSNNSNELITRLELKNNSQLILYRGNISFKKYFI